MVYVVGFVMVYFSLFLEAFTRYKGSFFYSLAVIYFGVLAIFRGAVGTDTHNYEVITGSFRDGAGIVGWEPGFVYLVKFLQFLTSSDALVIRIISLLFFLGVVRLIFKMGRDWRYFIMAFFIPGYFLAYSMNVLRVGIATLILFYLVVAVMEHSNKLKILFLSFLAVLFQYSILFSLFFVFSTSVKVWSGKRFFWLIGLSFFALCLLYSGMDYLVFKLGAYTDNEYINPGGFSGLSIVAILLVLLCSIWLSNLPKNVKGKLISFGFIMMVAFYFMASYTYAGLRLLDLLSVSLALTAALQHAVNERRFNSYFKGGLLFAGLLSGISTMKGFVEFEGVGESPFLPYHFFWQ